MYQWSMKKTTTLLACYPDVTRDVRTSLVNLHGKEVADQSKHHAPTLLKLYINPSLFLRPLLSTSSQLAHLKPTYISTTHTRVPPHPLNPQKIFSKMQFSTITAFFFFGAATLVAAVPATLEQRACCDPLYFAECYNACSFGCSSGAISNQGCFLDCDSSCCKYLNVPNKQVSTVG